ncbi:MAG: nucleotidyltransferase family protein [Clostridia bacterium]|nr:nucleotidyltransferase family protein [Clostridia bacterium]
MKATAIICEYNPFTNGHKAHIEQAKKDTNADLIICVMSGCFTQRGNPALLDKYDRAEIAIKSGADLVVELPLIYSISPADNFAYGALKIIKSIPAIDTISFGSECGDINLLTKCAEFFENEPFEYKELLNKYIHDGFSYPQSQTLALSELIQYDESYSYITNVLDKPNNILAISYIKQMHKLGMNLNLHTIKRTSDFNSTDTNLEMPSATAIRNLFYSGRFQEIENIVPPECYTFLKYAKNDLNTFYDLLLYKLKSIPADTLANYYDVDKASGMHNRIKLATVNCSKYEDFLKSVKTKKYTESRIKRISLVALFDITQEMYDNIIDLPPYINVLALRKEKKKEILNELSSIKNVLLRYSDKDKVDKQLREYIKLDFVAQGILAIINKSNPNSKSMRLI